MKIGEIDRALRCLPLFLALCWVVTDCSSHARDFSTGPGGSAGVGNESGGASGSGEVAGAQTAGTTNSGGTSGMDSGGMAGEGGMSVGPGGASDGGAGTLRDGLACKGGSDCVSGNCVDGLCCNMPCDGCNACSNTLTGQDNGQCAPVLNGQDPHAACADETSTNQCGNDGTCDGAGACAKVPSTHICAAAHCSSDNKSFIPASTCTSGGKCSVVTAQDCAGFPCTATGCAKPCTSNTDCSATNYCDTTTHKCVVRKADGSPATNTYECANGFVADGLCCNNACAGQCQSCKQTPGVCKAVSTPRTSCGGSGTCGTLKCDGAHADCVLPGNEVSCPATCASDLTAKLTSTCNGAGACGTPQAVACTAQYCSGGQCIPKIANNVGGCSTNVACSSGNCSTSPSAGTMCCAASLANCSQGCYNLSTDAKHCGTCAMACGANNACASGKCQCAGGAKLSCGTCPSWNFESNTTEGWVNDTNTSSNVTPAAKPTPPGAPFSGSTYSLAVVTSLAGQGQAGATVAAIVVPLCASAGTTADITGFSFWMYMDGPAYTSGKEFAQTDAGGIAMVPVSKQWVSVTASFATASASYLQLYFNPGAAWSGTIYIDQVQITQ